MDIASCHTGAYISRFLAHSFGSSPPVPLIAVRFPLIDARSAHRRRFHPSLPVSLLISTGDLRDQFNSRASSRSNTRNQTIFTGSSRRTRTSRAALHMNFYDPIVPFLPKSNQL
ncbi:hypothetical protein PGT21_014754 [Puccinia graminis f. sp. tritici]|uniref:Uncharacterized protein n=1 Tax=Puccinia graminis f. sp. tritici TaxID=56615 RepID=A0A5B0QW69_PUCGR|nr:hypothetical protein PGT21_014754 [Puccinia graminis f. sp. tritici]